MKVIAVAPLMVLMFGGTVQAEDLLYGCSDPPLEVTFEVAGGHYSGKVMCGNLFIEQDILSAPIVRYAKAKPKSLYTILMIDFDGNANGSWPQAVPSGANSPVRHWIVGNIPGSIMRGAGYNERTDPAQDKNIKVVQAFRRPHIPVVSDRYGIFVFEQPGLVQFPELDQSIVNFDYRRFLEGSKLGAPIAYNWFVGVYTSVSPFSGKPFTGNDISSTWNKDLGKGRLTPMYPGHVRF